VLVWVEDIWNCQPGKRGFWWWLDNGIRVVCLLYWAM